MILDRSRITCTPFVEALEGGHKRLSLNVFLDEVWIGRIVVASGPAADIEDLFSGQLTMTTLLDRWSLPFG